MNSKRKAVYAASLDPITNGHINVVERIAPLYDEVVVVVAVDSRKNYTFAQEERLQMAREALAYLPNVTVGVCVGRYVVNYMHEIGANVLIRGLRNSTDLEAEQTLAIENGRIQPGIETLWIPCRPNLMHVSSSMVRGHVGVDPDWEAQVARSVPGVVVKKLKEKYIYNKALAHWNTFMQLIGKGPLPGVFAVFQGMNSEPHRVYHTLEHIVSMLDEYTLIGGKDAATILAIWAHDCVYNPHEKDNEEKSAEFATIIARDYLHIPDELVVKRVLITKHTAIPSNFEEELMVDLDLMILGSSETRFDVYEAGIRQEYAWVTEADFRFHRARILQSFLDRPSIYFTPIFREKYEDKARANLERSIKKLT